MNKIGWALVVLLVVVLVVIGTTTKNSTRFRPDFRYTSTQPYGSKAVIDWLKNNQHRKVTTSRKNLASLADSTKGRVTLCIVTDDFTPDSASMVALDTLLSRGSTVVINATYFSSEFLSEYSLEDYYLDGDGFPIADARHGNRVLTNHSRATGLWLALRIATPASEQHTNELLHDTLRSNAHVYDGRVPHNWRKILVSASPDSVVLAARLELPKGTLILSTAPQLFTNYGMLYDRIWNATEVIAGYLPEGQIVWDEYYKPQSDQIKEKEFLDLVANNRGLALAYWILLGGLGVYIVVYSRRRQRAIPSVSKPSNTTREFLQNIMALYWMRRDNKAVAERIALQVRKHLVHKMHINTDSQQNVLGMRIAAATGLQTEVVQRLTHLALRGVPWEVTNDQLIQIGSDAQLLFTSSRGTSN